jgi:hypothetical protein
MQHNIGRYLTGAIIYILVFSMMNMLLSGVDISSLSEVKPRVIVHATFEQEDELILFYLEPGEKKFRRSKSDAKVIPGDTSEQIADLTLPKEKLLKLRLDLGSNKEQKKVRISSLTFKFGKEKFVIPVDSIDFYFRFNMYTRFDKEEKLIYLKSKKNVYDPFIVSRPELIEKWNNLIDKPVRIPYYRIFSFIVALTFSMFLSHKLKKSTQEKQIKLFPVGMTFLFITLIMLPYLDETFGLQGETTNLEKRRLRQAVSFDKQNWTQFPSRFDEFYNDAFGLRAFYIDLGAVVKTRFFNSSPSERVIIGKEGWVFLGKSFKLYEDYTHRNLLDADQLAIKKKVYGKRKKLHTQLGIDYYKIYYPNKHSIYEEYLPNRFINLKIDTVSRAEQLTIYLQKQNLVKMLSVKQALLKAKKDHPTYLKVDSHWNSMGAFIAYQNLFNHIHKNHLDIKPYSLEDFSITWKAERTGGHYGLLGIRDSKLSHELIPYFTPKKFDPQSIIEIKSKGYPGKTIIHKNRSDTTGKVALIFRDSFTNYLIPFISPHFDKTIYIWRKYDDNIVRKVKPDIVIEGYVERYLE